MQSVRYRTGFSFRAATGHIGEVLDRIAETGATVAPITDRASTFGFNKWGKACKKKGLRPVYGVELAVSTDIAGKKPVVDYWTFISKGSITEINRLLALATSQFRYTPLLSYEQALSADCFKIVGHRSDIAYLVSAAGAKLPADLYYALGPAVSKGYAFRLREAGIRPAASCDNIYPTEKRAAQAEIILGRGFSDQSYPQHILSDEEWVDSISHLDISDAEFEAAIQNAETILAGSTAGMVLSEFMVPDRPGTLREMCEKGAATLGVDLQDEVYSARLTRELDLIKEKGYEDYFYIVSDLVGWARERMLVGPARGSSCGSLACYLLGITTVDPIPYGLLFERFVDINRMDMPDIDIDFADQKRHLVEEYAADKYGIDHVARLGTVNMFKARSALQTTCMELDVPRWKADKALDALVKRSSADARAMDTLFDTLTTTDSGKELISEHPEILDVLEGFEGHPRHAGQHAAGIVISKTPIRDTVAIDSRTGATNCDKKDAEDLNLLKIDALGLIQLSIFEDALALAGLPKKHLDTIPLDDPAAFAIINNSQFAGIFQYNGKALQYLANYIKSDCLEDIVSVTALARPGPLASGGANEWARRRIGADPVTYYHPVFEEHLKNSLGVIIYQEQVMTIGRDIGDLSWEDVTLLRKAMSKSLGKEYFDQFGDRWKIGALKKGISKEVADTVWDQLCAYGAWSFNRSHSVAYGLISYQCCWLKAHYPLEFAAATLQHASDIDLQLKLLREIVSEGHEYIPVDANQSTNKWTVGVRGENKMRVLVGPLQNVKGIGPKSVVKIMQARASGKKLTGREAKLLENPVTPLDSLFPIRDAFRKYLPNPKERNIFTEPTPIIDIQCVPKGKPDQEHLVFCVLARIAPRDENDLQNVAKRGYELRGPTQALNLRIMDDTDIVFAKVNRMDYDKIGAEIVERGVPLKHLYVLKGTIRSGLDFRMFNVKAVRYICPIAGPDSEKVAKPKKTASREAD